ncbi:hypothetical protein PGT21_007738 [Puccinia graminis f. sp. tritici]|uniref:Uncharacterized protein n=1 Tax=Puccinia graminis f. sp. tritici TaxID=56615 RepID=A0A5B0PJY5_PUCGR|nr:hypothetical protein PGT21_007738 [Puccinia graminis f. sp. tritici]
MNTDGTYNCHLRSQHVCPIAFLSRKLRQILQLQSNICSAPANPRVLCEKFTSLTSDIEVWIDMNLSGHLKSEFWNRLHARE